MSNANAVEMLGVRFSSMTCMEAVPLPWFTRGVALVGAGAFGIVFEATSHDQKRYAVKFLQAGLLATPSEQQALYNEVIAGARVHHALLEQVVDHGGPLRWRRIRGCVRTAAEWPHR